MIKDYIQNKELIKYFKNISWLFGEKVLKIIAGLFVGTWVARYLGPERFGLLSYAQSFALLFTSISSFGLDVILVRELVKGNCKPSVLVGTTLWLKLIGAFLALLLLIVSFFLMSNDSYTNYLIFIIAAGKIFQSFNVIDLYFQARVESKYVALANSISLLISSCINIILILSNAPLIYFAWVVLFDSFVLACGFVYFFLTRAKLSFNNLKFKLSTAFALLRDSWPLMLSGIVINIYMKIDQVMIKDMLGNEAVGQYAAAVNLSEAWHFIPIVICSSLFPAIIQAKSENLTLYQSRLKKLYSLMVLMAVAVALPMTFLSDWGVHLFYGGQYNQAASVLVIYIWANVFSFISFASGKWLVIEDLQKYLAINAIIGATVNIILNYIMIPYFGIKGAAFTTLISYFVAIYLCLAFWRKTRPNFYLLSRGFIFWRLICTKN